MTATTISRFLSQGPGGGAPNAGGDTNQPVVPETPEEEQAVQEKRGLWARLSEKVHTGLDVAGFIPGVGIFSNLANAGIYAAEGNLVMAGISGRSGCAGIGDGTMAAKTGKQVAGELAEKAAERATKEIAEEAAEKGTKEAGEETSKEGVRITGSGQKGSRQQQG